MEYIAARLIRLGGITFPLCIFRVVFQFAGWAWIRTFRRNADTSKYEWVDLRKMVLSTESKKRKVLFQTRLNTYHANVGSVP